MLNDCFWKEFRKGHGLILACFTAMLFTSACNPKEQGGSSASTSDNTRPDPNRFTPVALTPDDALDEPMNFEVLKSGKVYIAERKGGLKVFDPVTKAVTDAGSIAVNTKYTSKEGKVTEAEEGFNGFSLDPKFEENHWAYLYYAHPTEAKFVLGRWELLNDKLVQGSEKVMLEIPTQRETCCHTGGGMTWDNNGNLYLTVGNNTGNVADKSQTDERPDRTSWDDQRGSSNTNDLRGKILRIHPEADGTYSIPSGNLFAKGTAKTRPEIYVMGDRNPWRPSVDSKTGFLYWGEVGPDANDDSETTLAGMDELNQARGPGYFGWPYFIGENRAYPFYDYSKESVHPGKDPKKPVNSSVNNTGLNELPPAQPAFISYPYRASEKFPLVGSGGRCAVGGPIYHQSDFKDAKRPFPAYYEGKWIAADLTRGWIMAISMNEKGDYQSMEPFLPSYQPIEPIDIKFGPSGDLYVLEYGSNWFRKSSNAKLVRIEYNAGNRTPIVNAAASASGGAVPLSVNLSSSGTKDADGDSLKYEWTINGPAGSTPMVYATADTKLNLTQPGEYNAVLTVTDPVGAKNSKSIKIIAGNEPPAIELSIAGNKSFFFPGQPIKYAITANDKEDGKVDAKQVAASIDYASEGFDYAELIQGQRSVDASTRFAVAQAFISKSDCNTCHQVNAKSIGPMFTQIAERYNGKAWAPDSLAKKIRSGGSGVWGEVNMPAHPSITYNDAKTIVNYILNITDKNISTLPLSGQYIARIPEGDNGKGSIVVRAAYTDKGAASSSPLTTEKQVVLRSPNLSPGNADIFQNATPKLQTMFAVSMIVIPNPNGFIGFKQLDLTGIKQLELGAMAMPRMGYVGGTIEVRLDGPEGELLGQTEIVAANPVFPAPTANSVQNAGGAKPKAAPKKAAPAFNPFARPGIKLPIKSVNGVHDLYFVFKNEKAGPKDQLMSFSSINLSN